MDEGGIPDRRCLICGGEHDAGACPELSGPVEEALLAELHQIDAQADWLRRRRADLVAWATRPRPDLPPPPAAADRIEPGDAPVPGPAASRRAAPGPAGATPAAAPFRPAPPGSAPHPVPAGPGPSCRRSCSGSAPR